MELTNDATWTRLMDRGGKAFSGLTFNSCVFNNCGISLTNDVSQMTRVENVRLIRCKSMNSVVGPCQLVDVVVEDLATSDLLIVWGAFFRRVTLRGRIGNLKINRSIHDPRKTPEMQTAFDDLRAQFYSECDWALDISDAQLGDFSVAGVPAHLIRRDPKTQVVVQRQHIQSAEQFGFLRQDCPDMEFALRTFLGRSTEPDLILVAPKGKAPKAFRSAMEGLRLLREVGIAQPD